MGRKADKSLFLMELGEKSPKKQKKKLTDNEIRYINQYLEAPEKGLNACNFESDFITYDNRRA